MKTKKSLRVMVLALAVIMVFGVCSTAMAFFHNYGNLSGIVTGGDSQKMFYGEKNYPGAIFDLSAAYNTGNPGTWVMRGYNTSTKAGGMEATYPVSLNRGGIMYYFTYIDDQNPYSYMSMYQSVTSKNPGDYYSFTGYLLF